MKSLALIAASIICTAAFAGPPTSPLTPSAPNLPSGKGYGTGTAAATPSDIDANHVEYIDPRGEPFYMNYSGGQGNYTGGYAGSKFNGDEPANPVGSNLPWF